MAERHAERYTPGLTPTLLPPTGVQLLLDGVTDYLPAPTDVANMALDLAEGEAPFRLPCSAGNSFVGLAFKLEEGRWVVGLVARDSCKSEG